MPCFKFEVFNNTEKKCKTYNRLQKIERTVVIGDFHCGGGRVSSNGDSRVGFIFAEDLKDSCIKIQTSNKLLFLFFLR